MILIFNSSLFFAGHSHVQYLMYLHIYNIPVTDFILSWGGFIQKMFDQWENSRGMNEIEGETLFQIKISLVQKWVDSQTATEPDQR